MESKELLHTIKDLPHEARAHWHHAMRLVMSLGVNDKGEVDWESADLTADASPVSTEEWQGWLRSAPPTLWLMIKLLDYERPRPGIPGYADVCGFILDEVPSLTHKLLTGHTNPLRKAIEDACGARLGELSGGKGQIVWEETDLQVIGGWLAGRVPTKEYINPNSVKYLCQEHRTIDGALAEVYPALALKVNKAVRKGETSQLYVRSDWLDEKGILAILKALKSKPQNLDAVMVQVVAQGTPRGLSAIAGLLTDKKAGEAALFWLACAGVSGRAAAHALWDAAKGKKGAAAREVVARLDALPTGVTPVPGPACWLRSDLSPWIPPLPDLPAEPCPAALSRERLVEMCSGWGAPPVKREDLSPEAWADYLQVASMDELLVHPGPTWDRAGELGRLGRGQDQRFMVAAAHRLNPKGRAHWHRDSKVGLGHLFLWAGADRDTFVGAVALATRFQTVRRTVGWLEEQWITPLNQVNPPWKEQAVEFIDRIGQARPMLGPVDHLDAAPEEVTWDPRAYDVVATIPAGGAAQIEAEGLTIALDPGQGTLTFGDQSRRFPPVDGALDISVTSSSEGALSLGFGSVTWGVIEIPLSPRTVRGVQQVRLHRAETLLWPAIGRLVSDVPSGAAWLAQEGTDAAARLLAITAELRPELQPRAVEAALSELTEVAAPYRAALGMTAQELTLPARSFEQVLAALKAHTDRTLKSEQGWNWAQGHGTRRGGFVGPALRVLDGALPGESDLLELAESCPLYPSEGQIEAREHTECLGIRQLTWRLLPEEWDPGRGPLFYQMYAVAWPVEEGVALALYSGYDVPSIHWLLDLPYMPVSSWERL